MDSQAALLKAQLKAQLKVPQVAWPTLGLFAGSLTVWAVAVWAVFVGALEMAWGTLAATVAMHGLFTVMHDASHYSLSRHRWVNEVVGSLCGSAFLRAFVGFRYIHLQHHKHTNDPARDPDTWSGTGPTWQLPFRWATQDVIYRRFYKRHWACRPRAERLELVAISVVEYGAILACLGAGLGWEVLWLWVAPAKLTLTALAYTFDYLPHRPHTVTAAEDRYKTTSVAPGALFALLTCYQNLHGVHHLYPAAPFYRYGRIWRANGARLKARGVQVRLPSWRVTADTSVRLAEPLGLTSSQRSKTHHASLSRVGSVG